MGRGGNEESGTGVITAPRREADTDATAIERLRAQMMRVWSAETSADPDNWSTDNPAYGQCAVSSLIVQDHLGGELLRTTVDGVSHYFNRLPSGE